jgi:Domain of unknown function (DUF397)
VRSHNVSDDAESSDREWRTSSRSYGSGQCVQVAAPSGEHIDVRDSKDAHGTVLTFSSTHWDAFVASVRHGSYGL